MEDQAAFSDCHHHDGHGESVILKMPPIAFWLAFGLGSCDGSLKNGNNASGVVNQGVCLFKFITKRIPLNYPGYGPDSHYTIPSINNTHTNPCRRAGHAVGLLRC